VGTCDHGDGGTTHLSSNLKGAVMAKITGRKLANGTFDIVLDDRRGPTGFYAHETGVARDSVGQVMAEHIGRYKQARADANLTRRQNRG